jgi:outer membrane protein assembly factor BamB
MNFSWAAVLFALLLANWPQFRGPELNPVGTHKRLPEQWSTTKNVEWSVEVPGRGWSSPVVVREKVFLTTVITEGKSKPPQIGTDYSNEYLAELLKQGLPPEQAMERLAERDIEMPREVMLHYFLYCFNLKNGAVVWKKEIHSGRPPGGRHRKNSFVSETPVSDGAGIYIYVANLGLYAYGLDGKFLWSTTLDAYPVYLEFGTASSPALHENLLFVLNDNQKQQFLAAFDKRTGKQVWRTNRDLGEAGAPDRRSSWTTPFVWTNRFRTEVVTIGPSIAVSYDLAGKELWRMSGMSVAPIPSPFAYDGLLYIDGGQTRGMYAIKPGASGDISLGDARSNEFVVWSDPRAGTYLPTPVAYEGGLYVLSEKGILTRFDAKTGKMTYKERLDREAGAFTSSPWAYNGRIFCLSEEGQTFVVAAGETYKLLHMNPLDEIALSTPAIIEDRLLIRTQTRLYSIKGK